MHTLKKYKKTIKEYKKVGCKAKKERKNANEVLN
jgi:hypothetical protein